MTVWNKNLQSDYGAPCAGEVDDSYFASFKTFALTHPGDEFVLTFPASSTITTEGDLFSGIKSKLTIDGQGSTWTTTNPNGEIKLSAGGVAVNDSNQDGWYGAFTEHAAISATTVTLLGSSDQVAPGMDTSLFTPGEWALMTGIDLQGQGAPMSPFHFEYVQIVSVDSGAKTVTFTPALEKEYKKTWPSFDVYPTSGVIHGGPATLVRTSTSWDTEFVFNDLNFVTLRSGQQIYAKARDVTFTNCTCNDTGAASGILPTAARSFTINGGNYDNTMECDKMVGTFTINGGTFAAIHFQSSSGGDDTVISDATISTLAGTPRRCALHRCNIGTLKIGPSGYGCTDSLILDSNTISAFAFIGSHDTTISVSPNTMTGGVITGSKDVGTHTPTLQNTIPDRHYTWGSFPGYDDLQGPACEITDYTDQVAGVRDASNLFITTDLATGFPTVGGTPRTLKSYVVQQYFSATGNTGCAQAVDWSQAGAQNKPLGSYSHRVINSFVSGANTLPWIYLLGKITSIAIDVTTPYTGSSGNAILRLRGSSDDHKQIDLKTTGLRTITPGSVVGAVGADDITTTGTTDWFFDGVSFGSSQPVWYFPNIGAETSDKWPVFTITIITDQGFTFPDAAPPEEEAVIPPPSILLGQACM